MLEPTYIGDSVYVREVGGMIELTTRNGLPTDPSNTILLDLEVWHQLELFVKKQSINIPRGA